jgi:ubiquinone biosynthesis protein UbiJ
VCPVKIKVLSCTPGDVAANVEVGGFEESRMATSRNLRQRIRELAEELAREFGQIEEEEGECLMSRVEDFAAQIGDAVAARLMEQELGSREITEHEVFLEEVLPVHLSP